MNLTHVYASGGVALGASLLLVPLVRRIAHHFRWISQPRADRWNGKPVALCGGIAIYLACVIGVVAFQPLDLLMGSVLATGGCMFVLGLLDDLLHIKPSSKLIGQIMGAALAIYSGSLFHFFHAEVLNILFSFFWI